MKVCKSCSIEKPLLDFYKNHSMSDGHLNHCIPCVKSRIKKHREVNLEKIREYDRKRGKQPHRIEAVIRYQKTEAGKIVRRKSQIAYRERYPMKYAAHLIFNKAKCDGLISKASNCSICNSDKKVEGHHDDYTKPLDVRWLCKKCHDEWHRSNTPIYK
jgi:hypothetical protein